MDASQSKNDGMAMSDEQSGDVTIDDDSDINGHHPADVDMVGTVVDNDTKNTKNNDATANSEEPMEEDQLVVDGEEVTAAMDTASSMMTDDNGDIASGMNTEEEDVAGDGAGGDDGNDEKNETVKILKEDTEDNDGDEVMGDGVDDQMMQTNASKMGDTDINDSSTEQSNSKQGPSPEVKPEISMNLHDWLSLGDIEKGIESSRGVGSTFNDNEETPNVHDVSAELERLPYLLRFLHQTRPLAEIKSVGKSLGSTDSIVQGPSGNKGKKDPLVNRVVDRLEDVAATHSGAEGVDVVANYLAPALCKKISKLKVPVPKRRRTPTSLLQFEMNETEKYDNGNSTNLMGMNWKNNYYYDNEWDTRGLDDVARDPIYRGTKRKRTKEDKSTTSKEMGSLEDSDDEEESAELRDGERAGADTSAHDDGAALKRQPRRDSVEMAGEDSQESTVLKTLSEITSLISSSLRPVDPFHHNNSAGGKAQEEKDDRGEPSAAVEKRTRSTIALIIEDSILSEAGGVDESVSNVAKSTTLHGSDLGSTLASIMHYSPILQCRHVATAICRSNLDTDYLLRRIAANCPSAVPSLCLGCIDAYSMAMDHGNTSIVKTSKQGIRALAKLSANESISVRSKLQNLGIMFDVQLGISVENGNFVETSAMLIQHLMPSLSSSSPGYVGDDPTVRLRDIVSSEGHSSPKDVKDAPLQEPALVRHFVQTPDFFNEILQCLSKEIRQRASTAKHQSKGYWSMILQSLCLLLLVPTPIDDPSFTLDAMRNVVERINENLQKDSKSSGFVIAACVTLAVKLLTERTKEPDNDSLLLMNTASEVDCVQSKVDVWPLVDQLISKRSIHGLSRLISGLINDDGILGVDENITNNPSFRYLRIGLERLCNIGRRQSPHNSVISFPVKLSALLLALRDTPDDLSQYRESMDILKALIGQKGKGGIREVSFVQAAHFVAEATRSLIESGEMKVPLVMQAELEYNLTKLSFENIDFDVEVCSVYMLQLLHALEFLNCKPTSPFTLDLCSFPIADSFRLVERLSNGPAKSFLKRRILNILNDGSFAMPLFNDSLCFGPEAKHLSMLASSRQVLSVSLMNAIREDIKKAQSKKETDGKTEWLFVLAKSQLVDSVLHTSTVSALLTAPSDPPQAFTYESLCRDPMIVLKAPVYVWRSRGLRRIALSVLWSLINTNDNVVTDTSQSIESAMEYLAARDGLIVRCLLSAVTKADSERSSLVCGTLVGFIRLVVARRPGVVTILLKQGLNERDLDWLIENVPETMNEDFMGVFSERSALTAAERLVAADGIIRIAILHGSVNEKKAEKMLLVSLSQLIDSFYLVLGPVGDVPVNSVLALDDSSADTVQVARKAALRILKALTKLRGTRAKMKKEGGTALQKIISLCKAESTAPSRRKLLQFIKEIMDACSRAAISMGLSLNTQVAVA